MLGVYWGHHGSIQKQERVRRDRHATSAFKGVPFMAYTLLKVLLCPKSAKWGD